MGAGSGPLTHDTMKGKVLSCAVATCAVCGDQLVYNAEVWSMMGVFSDLEHRGWAIGVGGWRCKMCVA
jgi:hypothetical protein